MLQSLEKILSKDPEIKACVILDNSRAKFPIRPKRGFFRKSHSSYFSLFIVPHHPAKSTQPPTHPRTHTNAQTDENKS